MPVDEDYKAAQTTHRIGQFNILMKISGFVTKQTA